MMQLPTTLPANGDRHALTGHLVLPAPMRLCASSGYSRVEQMQIQQPRAHISEMAEGALLISTGRKEVKEAGILRTAAREDITQGKVVKADGKIFAGEGRQLAALGGSLKKLGASLRAQGMQLQREGDSEINDTWQGMGSRFAFSPRQIAASSRWATPLQPREGALPGVDQGHWDDCWFESSLAALAMTRDGQRQISQMIRINDRGVYFVRFPGEPDRIIKITEQEIKADKLSNKAQWANVLEAANIKVFPKQAASGSMHPGHIGLQLVTGITPTSIKLAGQASPQKMAQLAALVRNCLQQHIPMVTGTQGPKFVYEEPLVPRHVYAVVGCDVRNGTITIRNPYGADIVHVHMGPGKKGPSVEIGQCAGSVENLGGGNLRLPIALWANTFGGCTYASSPMMVEAPCTAPE